MLLTTTQMATPAIYVKRKAKATGGQDPIMFLNILVAILSPVFVFTT